MKQESYIFLSRNINISALCITIRVDNNMQ